MKKVSGISTAVLSQQLEDVLQGRRVRNAVFTTFSFDPGFFELNVLPLLFSQTFSQVDKVRMIQLEDALRDVSDLAVYYDQRALSQDAHPAALDYRRIDIRRTTGCFHPKMVLLLVDEETGNQTQNGSCQSLIVGILSANLTRGGWWENVECAHFEEVKDRDVDGNRCPFRRDLLGILSRIRTAVRQEGSDDALDSIHDFLRDRTQKGQYSQVSRNRRYLTRIFYGQRAQSLAQWLENLRLNRHEWNLEVVSPYFDSSGRGPLTELIEVFQPRETRVYLPKDVDGSARLSRQAYEAVSEVASWGTLPADIVERDRGSRAEKLAPRNVHAKVYRLWNKQHRRELLVVGSPNLTSAAHSHGGAGNLEAAFFVDISDVRSAQRWWLAVEEEDGNRFSEEGSPEETAQNTIPIALSLRYDWATNHLGYWYEGDGRSELEICETSGRKLFTIDQPKPARWIQCGDRASSLLRNGLKSTSFFLVRHPEGEWRVLIREENMTHRPSLLTQLTPEEILQYWSLLSAEQRAAFMDERALISWTFEDLRPAVKPPTASSNTLFDRFAGIFHAFGCLQSHVEKAMGENRESIATGWLAGAKYDSLPVLLEKTLKRQDGDPVIAYVTFLCAEQALRRFKKRHRQFFRKHKQHFDNLNSLLEKRSAIRKSVQKPGKGGRKFMAWYEETFLREL